MEKNEEYTGEVIGLGTEGEGIIKCEGRTVFVPLSLVGETVSFKVLKVQKDIAYGKVLRVITPSPDRTIPVCPAFPQCGGCSLQHMKYPAQLKYKSAMVRASLKKIGGISAPVADTVPCAGAYRYRNKLSLPIGLTPEGDPVCGFYAPRSHRIIPVRDCYIQAEWVKDIISCVTSYAGALPREQRAKLRHIVVRKVGERHIIALVAAEKVPAGILTALLDNCFTDYTFLLNVNPKDTNVIFGSEWHTIRGEGFLKTEEGGISFTVGANTFMQVNDEMRSRLYSCVLHEAGGSSVAIDLYSGGGLLTAMLAKSCGEAWGIEIVPEATQCADTLMEENGLTGRMHNICGAAEDNIQILQKASGGGVIVCDPPRKGMERSVVKAIRDSGADKVILISCNPATLARDLGLLLGTLVEEGKDLVKCMEPASPYTLQSVTPFDMFPQTKWCETAAVLTRK
ncbi:MAG: 23S rRNA (uracil(1939)-C(5))-methyltransferase RlmD [Clostridia bacterium]|nr:23S rRNA (uracil(1939)-C(5))-methyltransferase RlmD [Clostridia bacterium]